MACRVDITTLDAATLNALKAKSILRIKIKTLSYEYYEKIKITRLVDSIAYIPFNLASQYIPQETWLPKRTDLQQMEMIFSGTLRPHQAEIEAKALAELNNHHSVVVSCYTGFGKTITAIALACRLKLKTLICTPRLILFEQWINAILNNCDNTGTNRPVSVIYPSKPLDPNDLHNFAIINPQNIHKIDPHILAQFGTVIIDEIHLILSKKIFRNLLYLTPRYLVALSATSYRPDDLNMLFPVFFNPNHLYVPLNRHHIIYKVNTGFAPEIQYTKANKINWNKVLDDQSADKARNDIICRIIQAFPTRNFLVIVKRISHGEYLYNKLLSKKENVELICGLKHDFDKACRVLIGTIGKIGTGFDFEKLDTLLLAADTVEYYIQLIGRIMRTQDKQHFPIIFDLVDDNVILKNHFDKRCDVYRQHGGTIRELATFCKD